MKQKILERARSTVEGFLHRQSTALTVLSVDPEVNGYGDGLLLIRFTYDDGNDAEGLPDSPALLKLTAGYVDPNNLRERKYKVLEGKVE